MASIVVVRAPSSLGGVMRRYRIVVDGVERGSLAAGEELVVEVRGGAHEVQARIDWTGSPPLAVTVDDPDSVSLVVEPAAGNAFTDFLNIFGRHRYLRLRPL